MLPDVQRPANDQSFEAPPVLYIDDRDTTSVVTRHADSSRGPNGPEIEKETTHDLV